MGREGADSGELDRLQDVLRRARFFLRHYSRFAERGLRDDVAAQVDALETAMTSNALQQAWQVAAAICRTLLFGSSVACVLFAAERSVAATHPVLGDGIEREAALLRLQSDAGAAGREATCAKLRALLDEAIPELGDHPDIHLLVPEERLADDFGLLAGRQSYALRETQAPSGLGLPELLTVIRPRGIQRNVVDLAGLTRSLQQARLDLLSHGPLTYDESLFITPKSDERRLQAMLDVAFRSALEIHEPGADEAVDDQYRRKDTTIPSTNLLGELLSLDADLVDRVMETSEEEHKSPSIQIREEATNTDVSQSQETSSSDTVTDEARRDQPVPSWVSKLVDALQGRDVEGIEIVVTVARPPEAPPPPWQEATDAERPSRWYVFISYRFHCGWESARLICAELDYRGMEYFLDTEYRVVGDFKRKLDERLEGAATVVVVLTPGSLATRASEDDGTDYFHYEIRKAMDMSKQTVPALFSDFAWKPEPGAPDDLVEYLKRQDPVRFFPPERYGAAADRLIELLSGQRG